MKLKSLDQFKELIKIGYEIQFTLDNKHWLVEPDQQAPDGSSKTVLASTDQDNLDFIARFKNIDDFFNYEIDGKKIKDNWQNIVITDFAITDY